MAGSSNILSYLLLGGAAYIAYEYFFAPAVAAAPAAGAGTPACPSPNTMIGGVCTAPISCPSPNTMVNGVCTAPAPPAAPAAQPIPTAAYSSTDQPWAIQMAAAASANSLNIDQWNYYFNNLANTTWSGTLSPISATQEGTMLAKLATLGQSESSLMTMPQWYWLVTAGGGGLSGLAGRRRVPVPALHARGFGHFTLGDLRRAGGR